MKTEYFPKECSFTKWYPKLSKNALKAEIIPLPDEVCKYLELDAFILPVEAISNGASCNSEWSDGSAVVEDDQESAEIQPSFLDFSKQIQNIIDDYSEIFIKCNWSSPSDAMWVTSTKTLRCTSLEDVYLLLKSSDRISKDLNAIKINKDESMKPCLILKKWKEIDPCTEFRCFVIDKKLMGISQRDVSQYYKHIENEKYDIKNDIKSLFLEKIQNTFDMENYTFDVIRYKKDKVKILDFGALNEYSVKDSLFTLNELKNELIEAPEFRFIAEDMGIQPKTINQFCIPQEINEFFHATGGMSVVDTLREEVEKQSKE